MDVFATFDLDEPEPEEARELKWIAPSAYRAEVHTPGWFMDESRCWEFADQRDLVAARAVYLGNQGKLEESLEMWIRLRDSFVHKGASRFAVADSVLTSALEVPSYPLPSLLAHLSSLRTEVANYGDQMHYLVLVSRVHTLSPSSLCRPPHAVVALVLLATLLDLPEHWIQLGRVEGIEVGPHFRLGCRVKAILLAELQSDLAHGFVRTKLLKDVKEWTAELQKEYGEEELSVARAAMRTSHVGTSGGGGKGKSTSTNDDLARPAHLCRWSEATLLTPSSARATMDAFESAYPWLLEGMQGEWSRALEVIEELL